MTIKNKTDKELSDDITFIKYWAKKNGINLKSTDKFSKALLQRLRALSTEQFNRKSDFL